MGFSLDLRYHICLQPINLPVFNSVALELLQLLADPLAEINHVLAIIEKDQALALQVLRMANSSAYVGRTRSETIKDAVNRLGIRQISNLAMAASQAALHTSELPVVSAVMKDLWLHSHACAVGCRSLALLSGHRELADQAYLAGLLHDIGKLYLLKAMERISLAQETSFELDLETLLDVFSDMHVEQGVRIMNHWDIPPLYRTVVAGHHTEFFDVEDTLLMLVRLVNFQSVQCGLNLYPRLTQPLNIIDEMELLGISDDDLCQLEADMQSVVG